MEKHVIVCGMPEMLHEFLEPFKAAAAGGHSAEFVPLLFLWDGPISDQQMQVDPLGSLTQLHPLAFRGFAAERLSLPRMSRAYPLSSHVANVTGFEGASRVVRAASASFESVFNRHGEHGPRHAHCPAYRPQACEPRVGACSHR